MRRRMLAKGLTVVPRMSVEQRRSALIESAYRVIADHGVEGATTRRICAHAGMPLASFHYAFESRTALLCAVMEQAVPVDIERMLHTVLPAADYGSTPTLEAIRDNMERQFHAFYDLLKADPGRMQATIALGIYAHNHPELQQVGRDMYEQLYRVASTGLRAVSDHAPVTFSRPVEELGPFIIAATNSITLIYLSTGDDKVVDSIITAVADQLITYVLFD
ncbi:TetR family transcriptional regulator [Gordonia westfalica]|uniref:TetR family transcriptional regulator n=2 Tax=Gordonia westfalica TaxID=158898 RepID=A0ABU2GWN1_9ACTN|nr:TetR family transcriptional regulator [Gordonia westfalica]MDS1115878.1 TetR family transcriptional regulator [Gordonia westfalica]